jgi:NIPSNAP
MLRNKGVTAGLIAAAFGLGWYGGQLPKVHAQATGRVLEIRTYTTNDGKLPALVNRMRDTETKLFAKHGMQQVLYSVAADAPQSENTFIYILAHANRDAAKKSWDAFRVDPDLKSMIEKTEADGRLVKKVDSVFVNPTDYSPTK